MADLWRDMGEFVFVRYALLACVLCSLACGVIGSFVVVRRITYIAGGVSHCVLGGIGAALYLQHARNVEWIEPTYGAVAAALLAAVVIGAVSLWAGQREDTVIGAVWAVGMAAGVLFMKVTPGYNANLSSYLFGNILLVGPSDLAMIAGLDVVIVVLSFLFYNQLQAVCFDEEFSRVRGINVQFYYFLLLCLTALTVVLLVWVVGIVLVIALLTLPAAVAGYFSRALWQMMAWAIVLSLAFSIVGFAVSYGRDLPPGPTIIVVAGGVYLLIAVGKGLLQIRRA